MAQTDSKASLPASSPNSISLDPRLFIQDVAAWGSKTLLDSLIMGGKGIILAGSCIEEAKQFATDNLRARNSRFGRPFSAVGLGGLTAVIGAGGLLFGHNGFVSQMTQPNSVDLAQVATVNRTLLANDVIVDSPDLHTTIPSDRLRDSVISHTVLQGESLQSIAKDFNVSVDSITYVNNLGLNPTIKPGQQLLILPTSGVLYQVKAGDSLQSIADKWKVPAQAIVDVNWLDEPYQVSSGQKLVIPNAVIPTPTPTPAPKKVNSVSGTGPVQGSGIFSWPTSGVITQGFSYYHEGIDIGARGAAPPITAAADGKVSFAGWWNGGGGNSVWIDHGNGYVTQYAHMSSISVSVGQSVGRGQQVGIMGNTGRSFGTHLMFNVIYHGKPINPLSVL